MRSPHTKNWRSGRMVGDSYEGMSAAYRPRSHSPACEGENAVLNPKFPTTASRFRFGDGHRQSGQAVFDWHHPGIVIATTPER